MFLKSLVQAINRLTRTLIIIHRSQSAMNTMMRLYDTGVDLTAVKNGLEKEEEKLTEIFKELS